MIHSIIAHYQDFKKAAVDRIAFPYSPDQDSLIYWRSNILFTIILVGWIMGTIAFFGTLALYIREHSWGLVLVDVISFFLCMILIFSNRIRYEVRSSIALSIFYFIGTMVILSVGPLSGGPLWMYTFAILVAVLLGSKPAILAVLINGLSLSAIAWLISTGKIGQEFPFFKTPQAIFATGINFLILNTIAAVSVAVLVKGLVSTHNQEKALTKRLEQERIQQRKIETQLRKAQKMESIGVLAGGIAHDFNNILASIIGFTELAIGDVEKGTNMEANLQEVYAAGIRAKDLVRQILAFARQSEQKAKAIEPAKIAKEVLRFMRSAIPSSIEIREYIESDASIMGNATQVHQVLMNLCANAAHAMEDDGGTLEIHLKDVVLDRKDIDTARAIEPGDYIEIKVSDTGVGIPPNIIDVIFEPYFTTKGPGEGTGMGLAMVHGIVEGYGGRVLVDSSLGQGTVFTIYLPITRKRQEHQPYEPEKPPSGTENILLVDDEASIAKMGSYLLQDLGYKVTARTSSVDALELFRSKPSAFDLVISDMTMPNMTGDILAAELMIIRPDIPVIIFTGYSKKISDETALGFGIKAFAHKPVIKTDLAKIVRKVLDEAGGSAQEALS